MKNEIFTTKSPKNQALSEIKIHFLIKKIHNFFAIFSQKIHANSRKFREFFLKNSQISAFSTQKNQNFQKISQKFSKNFALKIGILSAFCVSLNATDATNPFSKPSEVSPSIVNEGFVSQHIDFNSDARLLKSLQITYITLDGSEKTLNLDINQSIDWHDSYALVRVKAPQITPSIDAPVTSPEAFALADTNSTLQIPNDNGKLADFISFASYKDKIKLITQDDIIGDFAVANPTKIIIDFKRDASFATKSQRLRLGTPFKRLQIGAHKGYYRLVIYLDGKYNYKIERDPSGYVVNVM